ncbi:MAG: hypothetical protein DSZ01_05410, partial [Gammaproteobacteria bacterium]
MEQHGQTQQDRQAFRGLARLAPQLLEERAGKLAPVGLHQPGEQPLRLPREPRQVGVGEDVGAVLVVAAVGDGQAEFVQTGRPLQQLPVFRLFQVPVAAHLLQQVQRGGRHPFALGLVQAVALYQCLHRPVARIVVLDAAQQLIEQTFSQGEVRNAHLLDIEGLEHGAEHRETTGEYRPAIVAQRRELHLVHVARFDQGLAQLLQRLACDPLVRPALCLDHVTDGADGPGTAHRQLPVIAVVEGLHGTDLQSPGDEGGIHGLAGHLAVREETLAEAHAAHEQAFAFPGRHALADDELILGHRDSEWTGHAPILEEDIAMANLAQDELGHAAIWYGLHQELTGQDPDRLAFQRNALDYRNVQLVELPIGD